MTGWNETGQNDTGWKENGRTETGWKETEVKTMGAKEMGGKAMGVKETVGKEMGAKETRGKAPGATSPGAQDSQETGGKGNMLMGEREMDNMLPGDTTERQNATVGIRCKSYSEVVIEGVRRRAKVFVGDLIVRRKTDRALSKGNCGSRQGRFYFSTHRE